MCSHCDCVEASYWSRSLESDAAVRADYTLTTMTTHTCLCSATAYADNEALPAFTRHTPRSLQYFLPAGPQQQKMVIITHPFNGPFSGTTQVSRYQKGKTNLDFTEARGSEWQ